MRAQSLYGYFPSKHAIYDAMFGEANRELVARWRTAVEAGPQDPVAVLRRRNAAFLGFCVEEPVRHQLLFQRTIPGFEPSPESYAPAVEGLEDLHSPVAGVRRGRPPGLGRVDRGARGPGGPAELQRARRRPVAAARRRDHRHVPRALRAREPDAEERTDHDHRDARRRRHPGPRARRGDGGGRRRVRAAVGRWWTGSLRTTGRRRTDCPGWDVRDMVSHLLGFMEAKADPAEAGPPGRRRDAGKRRSRGSCAWTRRRRCRSASTPTVDPADWPRRCTRGPAGRWRAGPRRRPSSAPPPCPPGCRAKATGPAGT